jgi:hypothetical protein
MDPYLERHWGDVHDSLIYLTKEALQPQLGGSLVARSEERVYLDDEDALRRQIRVPDVRIIESGIRDVPVKAISGVAVAEPIVIEVDSDPITESFIQILDSTDHGRVVTVIEFVSPSNKLFKAARASYKKKQEECLEGKTNLVEVDLTRAGNRELLIHEFELPHDRGGEYMASVYRANIGKYGRREGYGIKLRDRLPAIRIPLRADDPDIVLDLQALVDQAYKTGAYGRTIDYQRECDPPLLADDAVWADRLLKEAGRR